MRPRRWLGLVFVFVFLPVNAPLLRIFVELPMTDGWQTLLTILLFIAGLVLLFFPTRAEVAKKVHARTATEDE